MATAAADSDSGNGNGEGGSDVEIEDRNRDDRVGNPGKRSQETRTHRQAERIVRITEASTETFHGLDELSSCINSIDDHVQAGLQELRNCVANLRRERSEMSEKVLALREEVRQTSVERDHYQLAVEELQQEIGNLRKQLSSQQQDRDALYTRMQNVQKQNDDHLVNIAEKQRSKRLMHRTIARWRKKALDKRLACSDQIRVLEAENSDLRAELLLCQEAAKQAFLRSANALNSEALTMFQDAATRRLGLEEMSEESDPPYASSPPKSPSQHVHSHQNIGDGAFRTDGENKENRGASRRTGDWSRQTDGRGEAVLEGRDESGDDRSYIATYGSDDHINHFHRNHSMGDLREQANYGTRDGYHSDTQQQHRSRFSGTYTMDHSSENLGAVGGRVPSQSGLAGTSAFDPDALQQETRAYLQQLREEKQRRPYRTFTSGYESQRKSQKVSGSHAEVRTKTCTCRTKKDTVAVQGPYRCPYCTPVQNSSFGHAKDVHKKVSNITRSTILSNTNKDKKKVLYKPSASTVVIEKHITR